MRETFRLGQLSFHRRKYGMGIQFRGRAHEHVNYSWYYASKEADINMRRPGAYGPLKEDMDARFARFRRDLPTEASRWSACEALGIPRMLLRRREINRLHHRLKLNGFDPAVVRGKCARFGKRCVVSAQVFFFFPDDLALVLGRRRSTSMSSSHSRPRTHTDML